MCTMLFETIEFGMPNGTFSRSHVGAILVFEMRSYIKTQNLPFLAFGDPHACLEVNFFVAETIKIFIELEHHKSQRYFSRNFGFKKEFLRVGKQRC